MPTRGRALLRAAYEYFNAGVMPVPLQGGDNAKQPLWWSVTLDIGFKTMELSRLYKSGWGESPFSWERFEEMFLAAGGIGIAVGACSGGLAVVDFDDPVAHKIWIRENAEMAARMPAVKTARGVHYYLVPDRSTSGCWRNFTVSGRRETAGQLKFANGYVVAPPTKHPDGMLYEWVGPSILSRRLPVIDLVELGLAVGGSAAVEADQESDQADQNKQLMRRLTGGLTHMGGNAESDSEAVRDFGPEQQAICLVRRHLPRQPGTRNLGLLRLVRSLKCQSALKTSDSATLRL